MNPLLQIGQQPAFDQVRGEHVQPAIAELLDEARAEIAAISAVTEPAYENVLTAFDRAGERLGRAMSVAGHLEMVATTPHLREAYNEVQPLVAEFHSSIWLDEKLWSVVKAVPGAPAGVHTRYWKKTVDAFKRSGADLPADQKKRLSEIDVELATITKTFSDHVLDSTAAREWLVTDEAQLAGLPESARAAARMSAQSKGKEGWRFTLQAPSYNAVLTYLDDRTLREAMYRASCTRATEEGRDNRPLIPRILALRAEKARLLGFANFADLVLQERMAKSGTRALEFLENLRAKTEKRFAEERQELEEFAGQKLEPWDVAYWSEKLRVKLYDFDEEALRPYFPLGRVVDGMFAIFGRLFGVEFRRVEGVPVWDPAVECFEAVAQGGRICGRFYTDWYPRENKRPGAWMDALIGGGPRPDGGFDPHLGFIGGNLTPPVDGQPALLTHRDVETIFHEFGHLMHQLMSTVEVRSLAGTHVAWDFVELPSQIMENWCWEREALDQFARHFETGAAIPEELFDKMKRAKTFQAAMAQMRQLSFGIMDLKLHTAYDPARDGDVIAYSRAILDGFSVASLPPEHAMAAAFTHLFGDAVGYGAGYYSYKWAEVLDADAFSRFQKEGIFNQQVGREYVDRILSRGDSEDPAELYRSFMGRDPDLGALLARQGLA